MTCPKCDHARSMLLKCRAERDGYKSKVEVTSRALLFAAALITELEAKRKDQDIIENCIQKLKILIPLAEEPVSVKFERKEKIGGV